MDPKKFMHVAVSWGIEFGPIVAFFLTASWLGFMTGTALFVALTLIAMIVAYIRDGRLALFPFIAGFSVVLFGVLTLALRDPFFLIIKDTIYNGGFAIAIAVSFLAYDKPLLKGMFSSLFHMTDKGWTILSLRWMTMFALLTVGNEIALNMLNPRQWLVYKMWVTLATIVFGFYQLTLSRRERMPDSNKWGMNVGHHRPAAAAGSESTS